MTGIYKIRNLLDNKVYIGQSLNIGKRLSYHRTRLKINAHPNTCLQNAWGKYGEGNFVFEIIEECCPEELCKRENFWCKKLDAHNRSFGYNLTITTDSPKYKLSDESKKKIGDAHRGKIISEEQKIHLSIVNTGKILSIETKKKMSDFQKGRKWSEERKEKFSNDKKGKGPLRTEKWLKSKLKPVVQYNQKLEVLGEYPSIKDAANTLKLNPSNIVAHCKGKKGGCVGGFYFKYKN